MGDANASIPTVQPVYGQPMWGSQPLAASLTSVLFVSRASIENGALASYGLKKRAVGVVGCRSVSKKSMKWNEKTPKMKVDPERYVSVAWQRSSSIRALLTPTYRPWRPMAWSAQQSLRAHFLYRKHISFTDSASTIVESHVATDQKS